MSITNSFDSFSVLRAIPSGKPPKQEGGRIRDYKGMKGDGNCHLYALKLATGFQAELTASSKGNITNHRRKITELDDIWWKRQTTINLIKLSFQFIGGSFDTKDHILDNSQSLLQLLVQEESKQKMRQGTTAVAVDFFNKYRASSVINILDFKQDLEKEERIGNHSQFLLAERLPLGAKFVQLKTTYNAICPIDIGSQRGRYHALHNVFTDHLNDLFKMQPCQWMPNESIERLADIIREKGTVVVGAILGAEHALRPPHSLEGIEFDEYAVAGWTESTYQEREGVSGHSIVLVGVSQGYVIFVDPAIPCRANEKRKAYAIPYSIFCNKVTSTLGFKIPVDKITKYPEQHYLLAPTPAQMV
ncbi:hypothetical protein [Estrella lausannensis]|uniref:Uncharacterized protein n=1 Tax=Estrella lausannensis TaxID=483423 RepID=A0A0H5DSL6_9BACT|nr:hypothetical protein [Estrella lausannensis]CRX38779.1 hypothetical protein ELAC_1443 [Estrella lausannensis]